MINPHVKPEICSFKTATILTFTRQIPEPGGLRGLSGGGKFDTRALKMFRIPGEVKELR